MGHKPDSVAERFLACYWNVFSTFDQSAVNCNYVEKHVEINVLGEKLQIAIPTLVKIVPIKKDDEIVLLKHVEPVECVKRAAPSKPNQAGKKRRS